MSRYVKQYHGDYAKALATYNAGPGAVQSALKQGGEQHLGGRFSPWKPSAISPPSWRWADMTEDVEPLPVLLAQLPHLTHLIV